MSSVAETSGSKEYVRVEHDWYVEPEWCWPLLLQHEPVYGTVLDPCAGIGRSIDACRSQSIFADGYDIVKRRPDLHRADFTTEDFAGYDNVLFNPPYAMAEQFVRKALSIARHKVIALVQQKWLYSGTRHPLFTDKHTAPARIYHLSSRPSMPPGVQLFGHETPVKAKGGRIDYCFIVWARDHKGPPTTHWLKRGSDAKAKVKKLKGKVGEAEAGAQPAGPGDDGRAGATA